MTITAARLGDYIQTSSGRKFWPLDPRPEDVEIEVIATALSHQCRYSGHTRKFYSVAQHSVLVSLACNSEDALWGLLHDGAEAFCVDLPRPLKRLPEFAHYRDTEAVIMRAICERFGLGIEMPESVHRADDILLATEVRDLMTPNEDIWGKWIAGTPTLPEPIVCLPPGVARKWFLSRFEQLAGATA